MPTRFAVAVIAGLIPLPALGQEPIPQSFLENLARDLADLQAEQAQNPSVRVVEDNANVYAGADVDTRVIANLRAGAMAKVLDKAGNWYGVLLPNKQVGWVETRNVSPIAATMEFDAGVDMGFGEEEVSKSGWFEHRILTLLERAASFRDAYQDNPYVTARGLKLA